MEMENGIHPDTVGNFGWKIGFLLDETVLDENRDCGIKHAFRKSAIYCEIYRGFLIQF